MKIKAGDYKGWCKYCKIWKLFHWHGEMTGINCGKCGTALEHVQHDKGQTRLNMQKYAI